MHRAKGWSATSGGLGQGIMSYTRANVCDMSSCMPCRAKGMECCQELENMLDEYTRRKLEGRILALHGPDEANQHGFMFPYLQQ
jgi:hypothetical protein